MKNEPLGNMVIEKQDKVSGKLLNGAQFELYKCDSNAAFLFSIGLLIPIYNEQKYDLF